MGGLLNEALATVDLIDTLHSRLLDTTNVNDNKKEIKIYRAFFIGILHFTLDPLDVLASITPKA